MGTPTQNLIRDIRSAVSGRYKAIKGIPRNRRLSVFRSEITSLGNAITIREISNKKNYLDSFRANLDNVSDVMQLEAYIDLLTKDETAKIQQRIAGISDIEDVPESFLILLSGRLVETAEENRKFDTKVNKIKARFNNIVKSFKNLTLSETHNLILKSVGASTLFTAYRGFSILGENTRLTANTDALGNQSVGTFGVSQDNLMIRDLDAAAVVGIIPLRHVQEIEIARSGKILKFRATGSVFLANQEGGEDAVRIEGYLYRKEIIWLLMLWMMFLYGQGKTKEINDSTTNPSVGLATVTDIRKLNDIVSYDPKTTKPSYEFHRTFPFVSRHIIIPNTYIETMAFEERIVDGLDVIKYSLLLRTYEKPTGFKLFQNKKLTHIGLNKATTTRRMLEIGINSVWRLLNTFNVFVNQRQWTIANEYAGRDDVYYDYDIGDVAIATAMSFMGVGLTGGLKL